MDIQEKIKSLKKRLGLTAALALASSVSYAGNTQSPDNNPADTPIGQTIDQNNEKSQIKQYKRIIHINSLDEIRLGDHPAAQYNPLANAIIYTQYQMENADKFERDQIKYTNNDNYSVKNEDHELFHHKMSSITQKLYDGSCIVTISDRIRCHIIEEICCLKAEEKLPSIADAIKRFKELKRDEYYSGHYGEADGRRIGSILIAMTAKEKTPEQIVMGFKRSDTYKVEQINGQEYIANLYTSLDNKVQTWALHDSEDRIVRSPEIVSQSKQTIGMLYTNDGKEIKLADNKTATTAYERESVNGYGGWNGYSVFKVSNFDQRTQGYDFSQAKQNFNNICQEYAEVAGLSTTEMDTLKEYVSQMSHFNTYDLQNHEIKEIKEAYKNMSLKELTEKHKKNHEQTIKKGRDDFIKNELPYLIETKSPSSLISPNELNKIKIKTDAFHH